MKKYLVYHVSISLISLILLFQPVYASEKVYTFSIVPQQSAIKTAKTWGPLLKYLSKETGVKLSLRTNKDIPDFEQSLKNESHDFSYMNPYHYTVFHKTSNYNAVAKAKDKRIKGILVVNKDSTINELVELDGKNLAFPSPSAFAASILPRAYLKLQGIKFTANYVSSHDSVYQNIAEKRFTAGGGVYRTFKNTDKKITKQLRILWNTKGYSPHAIASHSRVPSKVVTRILNVLVKLHESKQGRKLLKTIRIKGFVPAVDSDWNDIRSLKIDNL